MPSDVSIVVADPSRLAAIRDGASLPGRIMTFTTGSVPSAIASIKAYRPRIIAVDAIFADTPAGAAFIERVEPLTMAGSTIKLVLEHDGRWIAVAPNAARAIGNTAAATANAKVVVPTPPVAAAPGILAVAVAVDPETLNTRRAPRFAVRDQMDVVVESGHASLIDLSALGAQIVSLPALRPRQKIKVDLNDDGDALSVVAQVAWSLFEKPQAAVEPHYRVGLEFTGQAQQALDAFRHRHCAEQPIPQRAR
jgi:hypothetical protein